MARMINWTDKKRRNAKFAQDVAADYGIHFDLADALKHFKLIKQNLPKGTRDDCAEVYYAAKEYFAG